MKVRLRMQPYSLSSAVSPLLSLSHPYYLSPVSFSLPPMHVSLPPLFPSLPTLSASANQGQVHSFFQKSVKYLQVGDLVWNEAQSRALHSLLRDHTVCFGLEKLQGSLKGKKFRIGILSSALSEDYGGFLDVEFGTHPKVWARVKIWDAWNEMSFLRIRFTSVEECPIVQIRKGIMLLTLEHDKRRTCSKH